MTRLSTGKIIEILEAGQTLEIAQAVTHEERLRLHTEPTITIPDNPAFERWLSDTADKILSGEKAAMFRSLITFPLPTVDVTNAAYKELFKVFFASDRVVDYFFTDDELKADFVEYLEFIGEPDYWKDDGWEIMKNHVNGVMVVDLPALVKDITTGEFVGATERPEPYFYFVDTSSIINLKVNQKGELEWFAFSASVRDDQEFLTEIQDNEEVEEIAIVLDDGFYRRYIRLRNSVEWMLDLEFAHDLDYCPARQFWSTNLGSSKIQKANPATNVLGGLDWLQFSIVMKRHLELFAGFPIITTYEEKCDYENSDGFKCDSHGTLWGYDEENNEPLKSEEPCPRCSVGSKIVGPGAHFTAPAPKNAETDVGMPALHITEGDTDSLKSMAEGLAEKKQTIIKHMIGTDGEPDNNQAKNEKQVASSFESQQIVAQNVAMNFQNVQHFVIKTLGKLRYNTDFLGNVTDYGKMFFMATGKELQEKYEKDRTNSMPYFEQANDRDRIYKDRYKNNPEQSARTLVLSELEPLQDLSLEEIDKNRDIIPREQRTLKINFNDYIDRFERENGPITQFLILIEPTVRIATIQRILSAYVTEDLAKIEPVTPPVVVEGEQD